MRNPKRIDEITELINCAWKQYPDFRFWQIINYMFNFVPENKKETDPFFWEEDIWKEIFIKMADPNHGETVSESENSENITEGECC